MVKLDVVVVGAGFAGLTAAKTLHAAGLSVAVLEARDRVGGRAYSLHPGTERAMDLGGQWVGPDHAAMRGLLTKHNRALSPTYDKGKSILVAGGRRGLFNANSKLLPGRPLEVAEFYVAVVRLERMAGKVVMEKPWLTPNARRIDRKSLEQWVHANVHSRWAKDTLLAALQTVFAVDLNKLSLLHALVYIQSSGGLTKLIDIRGGAQQDVIVGGAQGLAEDIAWEIRDRIMLDDPVVAIEQTAHAVMVRTQKARYRATRLVLAVPPTVIQDIAFDPWLPEEIAAYLDAYTPGTAYKCIATYRKPFWREKGFSGIALQSEGHFSAIFDGSHGEHCQPSLIGLAFGAKAELLASDCEVGRRSSVIAGFVEAFGGAANDAVDIVCKAWAHDPWAGGGYAGMLRPGGWTQSARGVDRRWGRIHWAASEASRHFRGYMEGAVLSGRQTAEDILALEPPQ